MPLTKINAGIQLQPGSIVKGLINTTTSGAALITKLVPGTNILASSTGVDAGTGDVTLSATNYSNRRTVNDLDITVAATDQIIALIAITTNHAANLLAASSYPPGSQLLLKDETGLLSSSLNWVVTPNGTDTINGSPFISLAAPYAELLLTTNGSSTWTIAASTNYASVAAINAGTDPNSPVNAANLGSVISTLNASISATAPTPLTALLNATKPNITRGRIVALSNR